MKRAGMIVTALAGIGLLAFLLQGYAQDAQTKSTPKAGEFKSTKEKVSYGLGMSFGNNIARSLQAQGVQADDVDPAALAKGIEDAFSGAESRVAEKDLKAAFETFQKELIAKAKKRKEDKARERLKTDPVFKALAEKNATEGAAFLKENKAKEGVKTTESGLQYQVLKQGTGRKPKKTDVVKTHYHGTFPNGEVFDSSVEANKPAPFPVGGVIDGWTEALQMMPVGSKWRLVLPSELAYGLSGSGNKIGPNQVLVFELELLSIETPDAEANAPAQN